MRISFYKNNVNKLWLIAHKFKFDRLATEENCMAYTHKFRINNMLDGEFTYFDGQNDFIVNVNDRRVYYSINGFPCRFAPFYYDANNDHDLILQEVWRKINKEAEKLGLKKIVDREDYKKKNKKQFTLYK